MASLTRPSIAYAINAIGEFMHKLWITPLETAERVLRYLKSSPGKGFLFCNYCYFVGGLCNADSLKIR